MILFGCQSSLCVVVELGEELPSPADIQLAHSRLRALCLGGDDKTWTHTTPEQIHVQTQAQKLKLIENVNSEAPTSFTGYISLDHVSFIYLFS